MAFFLLVEWIVAPGRASADEPDDKRHERGDDGEEGGGHIYDFWIVAGLMPFWLFLPLTPALSPLKGEGEEAEIKIKN